MAVAKQSVPFPVSIPAGVNVWEYPIEGGLVLARPDVPGLFILNSTAGFIWFKLREGSPYRDLIHNYALAYRLPERQAAADVDSTLRKWASGLLRPPPPAVRTIAQDATFKFRSAVPAFAEDYLVDETQTRLIIEDEDLIEEIAPRLAALCSDEIAPKAIFHVFRSGVQIRLECDGKPVAAEENPNAIRAILLQEMVRVSRPGREWLAILHAGACGNDNGCVLLAAGSHSGKTTLSAALMNSGLKFFCDDSAAIDCASRQVVPMPFALMLREGSWGVLASRLPQLLQAPVVQRHGEGIRFLAPPPGVMASSGAPARSLLFTRFLSGAKTKLQPITFIQTLFNLEASGSWIPHRRESIGTFLTWLEPLPAFELTYSDLGEAVRTVRDMALV